MKRALRIVKLGGSLLADPALVGNLRRWLSVNDDLTNVLIVGGGTLVDSIEQLSTTHQLSEAAAHWLCIEAMTLNAHLLQALLPQAHLTCDVLHLVQERETSAGWMIYDPQPYLRGPDGEHPAGALPESWDVSSDSIAARLAEFAEAAELVLLKSALPSVCDIGALAQGGFVDRFFPQAAARLARIRCVDLRNENFAEVLLEN